MSGQMGAPEQAVPRAALRSCPGETSLQLLVAERASDPYYPRMILKKSIRVCSEELLKAKRAVVFAYGAIREADERTMDLLMMFLGIR